MSQNLPSLTVILPNYNHAHLIGDQLDAIFSQTIQPTKIIIFDDASTDDSVSVIHKLIDGYSNVEFICKETNSGVVDLNNEGLYLAETDLVTFVAADDIILPGFFEKSLDLLHQHPQAALCSTITVAQLGSKEWHIPSWVYLPCTTAEFLSPQKVSALLMQTENWMMANTVIYRRELLVEFGGQFPELMSYSDEFNCRALGMLHGVCFIPEPLAINRQSPSSFSSSLKNNESDPEDVLIHATALMNNKFSNIFSPKYVAVSNARTLSRILCGKLDMFEARSQVLTQKSLPIARRSLTLFVIRWAVIALKLTFFCVLRFHDIPKVVLSKLVRRSPPSAS